MANKVKSFTNTDAAAKRNKRGLLASRIVVYIVLILLSIICLLSFWILIVNSSRSHGELMSEFNFLPGTYFLKNWKNLMDDKNIHMLTALKNSLLVSGFTALFTTYFSALTAYALHAYNFKLKKFAFTFIMIVMMIPGQISVLGYIKLVTGMHLLDTLSALIIPSIASPIVFFYMKQYMESSIPIEIVEAARVDGSGEFRTFNTIIFPLLKPAVAVQAIFSFTASWNNYFAPALIISSENKKTIPIMIATLRSADYMRFDMGKVYMMIFVSIIPLVIVYFILSQYIIKGLTLGSVKG